jgi:preprotein translocase SecE subunit
MGKSEQSTANREAASGLVHYFKASFEELKRVKPPSKQEATQQTIAVLMLIVFFSIALALMDGLFQYVMGWLIDSPGKLR